MIPNPKEKALPGKQGLWVKEIGTRLLVLWKVTSVHGFLEVFVRIASPSADGAR